jgi:hypothetical protein
VSQLTEDEWDDAYGPIPNPVDESMIWDYSDPAQMALLRTYPEDRLWTFVDVDDGQAIVTGLHMVNRVGYVVTERPWTDHDTYAYIPDLPDDEPSERRTPVGPGDRVRLVRWHVDVIGASTDPDTGLIRDEAGDVISIDDNVTVPPGTEGTVTDVLTDTEGVAYQVAVDWDNDSRLRMMASVDQWEVVEDD